MLESAPPTFVLIHGAWHGGWCWGRVSERLRAKGARVLTPTLCGLAERASLATPEVGLLTHLNEIAALCDDEAQHGPLVLCGHSYGGLVLVGALEKMQAQTQVQAAVFLDAFVPQAGQSLFDMAGPQAAQRFASMSLEQRGCTLVAPVPAALFNVNEDDRAWVDAECTPQPLRCFTEKIGEVAAMARVSTKIYVRASAYAQPVFEATYRQFAQQPEWQCVSMPHGHDLMLDAPQDVSEVLWAAAVDTPHKHS
jgi:thioesterase domain-containing protein